MKIIIPILILLAGCSQKNLRKDRHYYQPDYSLLNRTWQQYHTMDSLPLVFIKKLKTFGLKKADFANPGESFNESDMITNQTWPFRQLNFFGKSGNTWMMTYKHGGFDRNDHFLVWDINRDSVISLRSCISFGALDSLPLVEKALDSLLLYAVEPQAGGL